MKVTLFMAGMLVLSGGIPGAGIATDVVDGIVDTAAAIVDTVGDTVTGAIQTVNSVGQTIGNGMEALRESPPDGPIIGGNPDNYREENQMARDAISELQETLNNRESVWVSMNQSVIQGNITDNKVINVVVVEAGQELTAIGANHTVRVNWSNISVEDGVANISGKVVDIQSGLANSPDLTVYPTVVDIQYGKDHYQKIANLDTRAEVGAELWERIDNMRCEPVGKCNHLRKTYWDGIVQQVLGGLSMYEDGR